MPANWSPGPRASSHQDTAAAANWTHGRNATWDGGFRRVLASSEVATLTFLCVTMATAIGGNLRLVGHIREARRHTGRVVRINCFLMNLAIGDIGVGAIVCTGELLFIAFGQWELGPAMCKLTVYTQSVCLASTAFLLTAMTVDRYEVIVRPLKILRRNSRVARRILACWAVALAFGTPQLFIFRQTTDTERRGSDNSTVSRLVCASSGYTASWQRKLYMLYVPLVVVAVPTVVMVFCYARIVLVIWRRARLLSRQRNQGASASSPTNWGSGAAAAGHHLVAASPLCPAGGRLLSRARIKAVFMSLTVVTAFLVCWLPYFLALLVAVYSDGALLRDSLFAEATKHLVLLHSVLNPIIYCLFAARSGPVSRLCATCLRFCRCCCRLDSEASIYCSRAPSLRDPGPVSARCGEACEEGDPSGAHPAAGAGHSAAYFDSSASDEATRARCAQRMVVHFEEGAS